MSEKSRVTSVFLVILGLLCLPLSIAESKNQVNICTKTGRCSFHKVRNPNTLLPTHLKKIGLYTLVVYSTKECEPCNVFKRKYFRLVSRYKNLYIQHVELEFNPSKSTILLLASLLRLSTPSSKTNSAYPLYVLYNPFGVRTFVGIGLGTKEKELYRRLSKRLIKRDIRSRIKFSPLLLNQQKKIHNQNIPTKNIIRRKPNTWGFILLGIGIGAIVTGAVTLPFVLNNNTSTQIKLCCGSMWKNKAK